MITTKDQLKAHYCDSALRNCQPNRDNSSRGSSILRLSNGRLCRAEMEISSRSPRPRMRASWQYRGTLYVRFGVLVGHVSGDNQNVVCTFLFTKLTSEDEKGLIHPCWHTFRSVCSDHDLVFRFVTIYFHTTSRKAQISGQA